MRTLVVEDDPKMASLLRRGLMRHGHAVDTVGSGEDALLHARAHEFEVIVLDITLPGIDGVETCLELRRRGDWTPVLMLTARDGVFDRVSGLDAGADDYLTKPFAFVELLARLRALQRRGTDERPTQVVVGDLRLDPATRRVIRGDHEIELSTKEFALLETFMRSSGRAFTRDELFEHAWDFAAECHSNVVDAYILRLRRKIDVPFGTESIHTIRGVGYRFSADGGR